MIQSILLKYKYHFHILRFMQKFNRYGFLLTISTVLYVVVQLLYSWRIEPSILGTFFILISVIIIGCNVFFLIRLSSHISDKLLKGFNSYLLISTFIFYLSYCLKASLITTNSLVLEIPFLLELILLITLIFNSYQIFIYSRGIKTSIYPHYKG